MAIGARLRSMREVKGLSQGDIEKSTGILRCYISRIENGHTVLSLDTLERYASALDVPLYKLFYAGDSDAQTPNLMPRKTLDELAVQPGKVGEEARFLLQFKHVWAQLGEPDRDVLLTVAKKLATR